MNSGDKHRPVVDASPVIETRKLSSLKPAPYNPRRIDAASMAALEKSIERFGLVQPIIVNKAGRVVGGHQRLKALKSKKVTETTVVVVDLSEDDEKALNVALNSPTLEGEFTADLAGLLDEIEAANAQLFAELRLGALRDGIEEKAIPEDIDDAPEPPVDPVTKPGDVWVLGRHRLICGDCTQPESLKRLLCDERVDILLTDPPYGVDYGDTGAQDFKKIKHHYRDIANDAGQGGSYRSWFASWIALTPWADYATFYVFMSGQELHSLREAIEDLGYHWSDYIVWVKDRLVMARKDYKPRHEFVLYGWPTHHRFYGATNACTVVDHERSHKNGLHPTMKPVALLEQLLGDGSADGAIVLDGFGGSGSTLIACETSHRKARLVEIDPAYCDVIVKRWEGISGGKAVLERETGVLL